MKAGWEVKPLGEVTSVINGLWKGKKGPYQLAKVVRNTNFRPNGQLNLDDVAEIEVELKQLEKRRLDAGDIVLERSGGGPKQPVGRVVLFDLDDDNFSFSNFTSVIRIVDGSLLCPRFLHAQLNFWYASGVTEPLQKQSTGIRNLDFKAYQALHLLIPPLEEQKRIVAVLDAAFEGLTRAKENAEANLQNARELFDSYLDAVGENKKPLGDFVSVRTGKLNANAAIEGGQYPFFTCSREIYQIDSFAFDCEAILLAGNNASGDFNVKHYKGKFNAYQRTYVIEVADEAELDYRFLYFQMVKSLKELKNSSVGAGTKFLKLGMIKNLGISLPSLREQQAIVSKLDELNQSCERLIENYRAKLTDISDLRQSLLQKAFAGDLT